MLLDDFCQIASPCLLVLFGNEWRTLLTIEGVPSEWFEVEMLEKGFVLGGVDFHFTLVYVLKLFLSDNHLSLLLDDSRIIRSTKEMDFKSSANGYNLLWWQGTLRTIWQIYAPSALAEVSEAK